MESLNLLYRNVSIEEFGYILSGNVVNAEGALGFPAVNVENGNGLKDGRAIFGWVGKNDQHKPYSSIQLTLKNIDLKSIGVASYIWTNQSTYDSGVYEYPEAHFNNYSWDNVKEVTIETFSELKSIIDRLNFDRLYLDDCSFYPENYWANFTQANLEEYYSERNMDNDSCRVEPNTGSILQAIRYLHQQFSLKIIDLDLLEKKYNFSKNPNSFKQISYLLKNDKKNIFLFVSNNQDRSIARNFSKSYNQPVLARNKYGTSFFSGEFGSSQTGDNVEKKLGISFKNQSLASIAKYLYPVGSFSIIGDDDTQSQEGFESISLDYYLNQLQSNQGNGL